ncbi:MAG: phosphotyrosine protein phosphatase [Candidatus Electrothrix sp. AR5]|nr:phosphotyrosine protein phosphatase [Candidatus Electrothrix sp. AR5]
MNILFICSKNKLRSPTGEEVFSEYDRIDAIGCGTNADAATPLSGDLIEWADIIFAMEKMHQRKINQKFRKMLKGKKIVCLDIADNYDRMEPALISLLKKKVFNHIPLPEHIK